MSKRRRAYPPEFRRQMVELVRSGRNPEELSREFEPAAGEPPAQDRARDLVKSRGLVRSGDRADPDTASALALQLP
jgi:hypothetical protein